MLFWIKNTPPTEVAEIISDMKRFWRFMNKDKHRQ